MPAILDAPAPSALFPSPQLNDDFETELDATIQGDAFAITLNFLPVIALNDDQFFTFCQINHDFRIERDAKGKVHIMAPVGGESSAQNGEITRVLGNWVVHNGTGKFFDSSGGFILPNGAKRSPDASWVLKTRLDALTSDQKRRFLPLCPDFVVELRSSMDALAPLQAKMEEYRANGARLGWLIDPQNRQVFIYRAGRSDVETLDDPASLSGEAVLPGFTLDLDDIWSPF